MLATYTRSFGQEAAIQKPFAIAINASGWTYVADGITYVVRVFDPNGRFVFQFGTGSLRGIAINMSTGHVYTVGQNAVRVYSMTGQLLTSWGAYGVEDGEFNDPHGIAVNGSGFVYVADSSNYRIQVFSPMGQYITRWGAYGTEDYNFEGPDGIGVNASGYVFVADDSSQIKVFDQIGQFLYRWGQSGSGDGEFDNPGWLAINASGYIYVSDSGDDRIQVFNQTGQFIRTWGSHGSNLGEFSQILGVATNASGHVFVTDVDNYRVQVFDQYGQFVSLLGKSAADPGCLNGAEGVAVNSTGAIYVADYWNNRVQVFSVDGEYLFHWYVLRPKALAINGSDCVYVSGSTGGAPAEVFSPAGVFLYSFGSGILPSACNDIAINASGCVFVTGVSSISVFGPEGAHLYTFGPAGSNEDQLTPNVMGIALGPGNYLHVTNNYRIKVFTLTGSYVRCYARDMGASSGGFSDSLGRVRVDATGISYVVDAGTNLVSAFAAYGSVAGEWGGGGIGVGQFTTPKGITINASGHAFIADASYVQLFSTVRIPRPARPVLYNATYDLTSGEVRLQWSAVTGAISYRVYRSSAYHTYTDATLMETSVSTSLVNNTRLRPDFYRYIVVAWNGYEESEASDPIIVEIPQDWTFVVVAGIATPGGVVVVGLFSYWHRKRTARV